MKLGQRASFDSIQSEFGNYIHYITNQPVDNGLKSGIMHLFHSFTEFIANKHQKVIYSHREKSTKNRVQKKSYKL